MSDDAVFRAALLIIAAIVLPIGLYHRVQSQATREKLDRRQEGLFMLATLRPMGAVLFAGIVAYLIDPAWMTWSSIPLPRWLRWTGVGLCIVGGALLIWSFRRLGKNLTDTVVTRQQHTLVTAGPYRWVRHPFYDSVALFMLGTSLIAQNWFLLAAAIAVFTLLVVRTRREEERLLLRFGDGYRAYMNTTGRFLPRIR
jgi:protein-S-isoprenylcysteine O-methyltransferase Ste14